MPFQRKSRVFTCTWARLSFPRVWVPEPVVIQGQPKGDPRFSTLVVVNDPDVARIQAIEDELIRESWPEWGGTTPPPGINLARALQPASVKRPGDAQLAGKWILSANAKMDSPPGLFRKDPATGVFIQLQRDTEQALIYSGCEADVAIGIFTTQMQVAAPQIDAGLNLICLTGRQLPRFDGRQTAEQAFGTQSQDAPPPIEGGGDAPPQAQTSQTQAPAPQFDPFTGQPIQH